MVFPALYILWLVPALTLATKEMVTLRVTPRITAECGKQVSLPCNVSSSTNGLSIKHLEWSHHKTSRCSLKSDGNITQNIKASGDFHCEYEEEQLSLIFQEVQPLDSGKYMCKVRSNKGVTERYTALELQECCQNVTGFFSSHGPVCTFHKVYPDGEVHWFHGSQNLSDGSIKHNTSKSVDAHGWVTIYSTLERKNSNVPFSCFLKGSKSGRYIASTVVRYPEYRFVNSHTNGVRSLTAMTKLHVISILLAVILKQQIC